MVVNFYVCAWPASRTFPFFDRVSFSRFTGLRAGFNAFLQSVANYVKDTNSLYKAYSEQCSVDICDGKKPKVRTSEPKEVDDDDNDWEDVGMETPSNKRLQASPAANTSAAPRPPKKAPSKPKKALGSAL